jgi:hypothetical protein
MKLTKRLLCVLLAVIALIPTFATDSFAAGRRSLSAAEKKMLGAFGIEYVESTGVLRNKHGKGLVFGFDRDNNQNIWFSSSNAWQRRFGYSTFYDDMAPLFNMDYETLNFYFDYGGKNWLIEVWKGRYGLTSGAEMGIYNKPASRRIKHYDAVPDRERLKMGFSLYDGTGELIMTRTPSKAWWCTGFVVFMQKTSKQLGMTFTIEFNDYAMLKAFRHSITPDMNVRCYFHGLKATLYWDM